MGSKYLTDMANVIRDAGVQVIEQDGWQTRARSSGGFDSNKPWCVMWHHTASSPGADPADDARYMSYNADSKPIANILLAHDGVAWVLAAGATNTNGKGGGAIVTSRGRVPADSMNTYAIGMEIQNSGVGETYPQVQIDNAFKISLALCEAYGLEPTDVGTHQEYAPDRKIDPATNWAVDGPWMPTAVTGSGTWSLSDLRDELIARSDVSTPPQPQPPPDEEDEDMPFIILNKDNGQPALVYGSGKVTGLAGPDLPEYIGRFGEPLQTDGVVFADFARKGD